MKVIYVINILDKFSKSFVTNYVKEVTIKGNSLDIPVNVNERIEGYVDEKEYNTNYEEAKKLLLEELKEDFDKILSSKKVQNMSMNGVDILYNYSNGIERIDYTPYNTNVSTKKYKVRIAVSR